MQVTPAAKLKLQSRINVLMSAKELKIKQVTVQGRRDSNSNEGIGIEKLAKVATKKANAVLKAIHKLSYFHLILHRCSNPAGASPSSTLLCSCCSISRMNCWCSSICCRVVASSSGRGPAKRSFISASDSHSSSMCTALCSCSACE